MASNPVTNPTSEDEFKTFAKELIQFFPSHPQLEDGDQAVAHIRGYLDAALTISAKPEISHTHRAAASNALCGLIERCQASQIPEIRSLLWDPDLNLWHRALMIILERFDTTKGKSMRQLLLTVTDVLLKQEDLEKRASAKSLALRTLLPVLFGQRDHKQGKPTLQVLAHFVVKDIVNLNDLWSSVGELASGHNMSHQTTDAKSVLLQNIFDWIAQLDTPIAAGNLAIVVLKAMRSSPNLAADNDAAGETPIWTGPLVRSITDHPEEIRNFKEYAFPGIFGLGVQDFYRFLQYVGLDEVVTCSKPILVRGADDDIKWSILFSALQAGKEMGIVKEVDSTRHGSTQIVENCVIIPDAFLGRLLAHHSSIIRISSFSLLATSMSTTRPFTNVTLKYLKRNFAQLFADTDARFRGDVLSILQRMVDRLRAATATLKKPPSTKKKELSKGNPSNGHGTDHLDANKVLKCHINFIKWLIRFLSIQIRPTASYQHHISALRALTILAKSGLDSRISPKHYSKQALVEIKWPFHMEVINAWTSRSLHDFLMNPFDDVRHASAALLAMYPDTEELLLTKDGTNGFLARARDLMLKTGRADHADGVARAHNLEFKLAKDTSGTIGESVVRLGLMQRVVADLTAIVDTASINLSNAVGRYPMHGLLSSIRYILDEPGFYNHLKGVSEEEKDGWRDVHSQLTLLLQCIWQCVRDILCNDAPEGHVPDEFEDDIEFTDKDILSYSWRALKEASSLIRVTISKAPLDEPPGEGILSVDDFDALSWLSFEQLAELRHRGAFSTVAQTFAACCARCLAEKDPEIVELPEQWYQETFLCIRNKGESITRRSAGIPSMITGILSAAPEGSLVTKAMLELEAEARSEGENSNISDSNLPQVHALNCLRAIFIHSKLGTVSERYVASGLELAASRLESQVWAIRNCGLMLFRALIDRLLGNNDVKDWTDEAPSVKTSRISYEIHGSLLEIFTKLLQPKSTDLKMLPSSAIEGVFPALQILQRAPPSPQAASGLLPLALQLTDSSHWHLRDMAARTYARLISPNDYAKAVEDIRGITFSNHNQLHGALLCVHYLIKAELQQTARVLSETFFSMLSTIQSWYLHDFAEKHNCAYTKMACIEILITCGTACIGHNADGTGVVSLSNLHQDVQIICTPSRMQQETMAWAQEAGLRKVLAILLIVEEYRSKTQETPLNPDTPSVGSDLEASKDFKKLLADHLEFLDPDTCCSVLEFLGQIAQDPRIHGQPLLEFIADALCIFSSAKNDLDIRVRGSALGVLSSLFHSGGLGDHIQRLQGLVLPRLTSSGTLTNVQDISPSLLQHALSLWGMSFDARLVVAGTWRAEMLEEFDSLLQFVKGSLDEYNEYTLRHAAAQCLHGLYNIWKLRGGDEVESRLLQAALAVYDALNDDDDDIRNLVAEITPWILAGSADSVPTDIAVPLIASQNLAAGLTSIFDSQGLCKEAIRRLTGSAIQEPGPSQTVAELLADAQKENTSLFVVEKQNLFIDTVREARLWSQVASSLSTSTVPPPLAESLAAWVVKGIATFTTAQKENFDGPLGFSSKPQVFSLGMQLIYAAEVLLTWKRLKVRFSVKASHLRRMLFEWIEVGQSKGMHEMWTDAILSILSPRVTLKVEATGQILREVLEGLRTKPC